jgi:hypothetical protein
MTEHEAQEGVNRRHLFQTLAAGAAASGVIGSPALAQQPPAAALAVATAADYALNPTRRIVPGIPASRYADQWSRDSIAPRRIWPAFVAVAR